MNEKEAISVLTQAVIIGQKHGAYSLKDSAIILQALTVLNPDWDKQPEENKPEEQKQEESK